MGPPIFRRSQDCCHISHRKITLAKSSSAKGGEKEVAQSCRDRQRSIFPIDGDPCSCRAGKSAPGNQRVYGPENDREPRVKTRASIWMVVDASGRETTCECLVTYERNAECHFRSRSAFIDALARSFLRSLEQKSRLRAAKQPNAEDVDYFRSVIVLDM